MCSSLNFIKALLGTNMQELCNHDGADVNTNLYKGRQAKLKAAQVDACIHCQLMLTWLGANVLKDALHSFIKQHENAIMLMRSIEMLHETKYIFPGLCAAVTELHTIASRRVMCKQFEDQGPVWQGLPDS